MLTQELATEIVQAEIIQEIEIVQEIDRETKRYLTEILAQEKITAGELIRSLIRDRWVALNPNPYNSPALRRKNSKQVISDFMRRKCHSPNLCI
jgi:hypothetical protein